MSKLKQHTDINFSVEPLRNLIKYRLLKAEKAVSKKETAFIF